MIVLTENGAFAYDTGVLDDAHVRAYWAENAINNAKKIRAAEWEAACANDYW